MKKLLSPWWLLVIAMAGTSALVYQYWWGEIFATNDKAEKLGQLGDFFGGLLNPLVSILTLFVAISVWRLQKVELVQTKVALSKSVEIADLQFQSSEQARHEATYVSCRADIASATATVAASSSDSVLPPLTTVTALSRKLETETPLSTINSHAVSFALNAPGFETPLAIDPWDWSIGHGNDAREILRLMLPLCRSIGDALIALSSMPPEETTKNFRRLRNSLDEWTLSTFAYFLVLHPDGAQYQTAAAAAHVLTNLRIQRALGFAKAYLPESTYSTPAQEVNHAS